MSVRLVYPESRAALAQAQRLGTLTVRQLRAAVQELDASHQEFDLFVQMADELARRGLATASVS